MINREQQDGQWQTIAALQQQIRKWERGSSPVTSATYTTGCAALDDLLPCRGVQQGSLIEWIGQGPASGAGTATSGAGTLSLAVARQVCPAERPLVLVDPRRQVFPLALAAWGFDLAQVVIVRPRSEREALWVCEEALRCEGVGLLWAEIECRSGTPFRRLQLAAEDSGGIGFLLRSEKSLGQPSWADARLLVGPQKGEPRCGEEPSLRLQVKVAYSHGRPHRSVANIKIDSMQGTIHEASDGGKANFMSLVS